MSIRLFKIYLIALVVASLALGCGSSKDDAEKGSPSPPGGPKTNETPGTGTSPTYAPDGSLSIDTIMVGETPEYVVYKRQLVINFQATEDQAKLECATVIAPSIALDRDYLDCSSGSYTFTGMVHGKTYGLMVRARSKTGLVDKTPLQVRFLVDLLSRLGGETADHSQRRIEVGELPQNNGNSGIATEQLNPNRRLQVGPHYSLLVPGTMYTASYSTSYTYNSRLHMLRILNDENRGSYSDDRCDRDYEQIVQGPQGRSYCEATPQRHLVRTDYRYPMPNNHVELLEVDSLGAVTAKLLVAAYDRQNGDQDSGTLSIERVCSSSSRQGRTTIDGLNQFYGFSPNTQDHFRWCQIRDNSGKAWWIGMLDGAKAGPEASQLQIIYTLQAGPGIISGRHFARAASDLFLEHVIPIAPTNGER